ncbi:hypothetical protein CHUAL_011792 [Chamberlinius hualienensis]
MGYFNKEVLRGRKFEKMSITRDTEIRRLHPPIRKHLAELLDICDGWKKLAFVLTKSTADPSPMYSSEEITLFECKKGSPTTLLLEDWGTRGRVRPTIGVLIENLEKAELYRASEYLSDLIPGSKPPEDVTTDSADNSQKIVVPHIAYKVLCDATFGFHSNYKLGQGGFGAVYLGNLEINGQRQNVAVKRLNVGEEKQFQTELKAMAKYRHENLLQILGFSCDNCDAKCLVCAYMPNGSLEERLSKKNGTRPLQWRTRLNIAIGTARGIVALHTMYPEPLVHRDIKSANILLDANLVPKIGDFGIAHLGADWKASTKAITSRWCGTPVYMADEALRGNITIKMDTFSFGVVLFELLTGLPPYDGTRSETSLIDFIDDKELEAVAWKDSEAGDWSDAVVENMFQCAIRCIESKKKLRPLMEEILLDLQKVTE